MNLQSKPFHVPNWAKVCRKQGQIELAGSSMNVNFDELEMIRERLAIAIEDGRQPEHKAQQIAQRELLTRRGLTPRT